MSPGNRQRSRSRVTKRCRRGSLHSCECWLLLVCNCNRCCVFCCSCTF